MFKQLSFLGLFLLHIKQSSTSLMKHCGIQGSLGKLPKAVQDIPVLTSLIRQSGFAGMMKYSLVRLSNPYFEKIVQTLITPNYFGTAIGLILNTTFDIRLIKKNYFLKYILIFCLNYICPNLSGQAYFIAPDTLCINQEMQAENLSEEASSYYWNFCSGNLSYMPEGENMGNSGNLNGPAFIDVVKDNDAYFAFITNHLDGTLTRYSYGTDFLSTPEAVNMGRFGGAIPAHVQGLQVVQENGNWHVFIIGGQRDESRLVRLDFGTSLTNNSPTINNLGNIGELDYPVDLYIDYIENTWVGLTVNKNTNTLTRFSFSSGLENIPEGENLGNPAELNSPCGILPIMENGNWYVFVSNYEKHEVSRLNFGTSIFNEPVGESIGGSNYLHYPFDLTIIKDCEHTYGFVLNRFNDLVLLDFENGLSEDPVFSSLGKIGGLYNPQGISQIFRVGDNLHAFVANIDNSTISRLTFLGCDNATPAYSTNRNPPRVSFNQAGIYNINLTINEGLPQQGNFCKDIVVLDSAHLNLGNDTIIPSGSSVILEPDSIYTAYLWSTGSTEAGIEVYDAGFYSLTVTNEVGCTANDDIEVIVDIGIPNFFTPNGDGYNDTWSIPFLTNNPEATLQIFDQFGNLLIQFKASQGDWDGRVNGNLLPNNTYWYVIKVPEIIKPFVGPVTIKK